MKWHWLFVAGSALAAAACGSHSSENPLDAGVGGSSSGGASSSRGSSSGGSGSGGSSSGGSGSGGASSSSSSGGAPTGPVSKVDLLFMIDNSASMGEKQQYLEAAIPDLVTAFTTSTAFPPVHDMHIGIVSSSLGPRLGDKYQSGAGGVCNAAATITINGATLNDHNDDQAHLLTRSSDPTLPVSAPPTEVPLPDASSGFLAWFPNVPANSGASVTPGATAITDAKTLQTDFVDLVAGVHEYGCGIESQLESWYRFLIQPDPYASLTLNGTKAEWVGVDTTIIKERHDFLRPDSLVVIVDLTDENDSEIDVRSLGGQGYLFMSAAFNPPHGTAACTQNPADPACTTLATSDPAPYNSPTDWGFDMNLRHAHMKAKYGIDPQYPVARYVTGLSSPTVPDRAGEYPSGANSYVGTNDCTNPLFAASLPDGSTLSAGVATSETAADVATLCQLPAGTRSKSMVLFTAIGGVPWQFLHFDPTNPSASELTASDWVRIVGTDPDNFNYTGIDPHMIESVAARSTAAAFVTAPPIPALNGAGGTSAAETAPQAPTAAGTPDPYNGREWNTNIGPHVDLEVDLQYACIFKLNAPRDCSRQADGTYTVPANGFSCDCSATGLTPDELSPVCDPANPTAQLYAKAYPTIRELELAWKLGPQAVTTSICPIDVADNATGDDPLYGYRPAVLQIVNRVTPLLAGP